MKALDCRVCHGRLDEVLSLGPIHTSGFVLPEEPDSPRAPLELMLCGDCGLVQLSETVPPEAMYKTYWYRSGTNRSMREALADIAEKAESLAHLKSGEAVLDIGCNDGTLLASYRSSGIVRIGYDPAANMLPFSEKIADPVIVGFFDAQGYQAEARANRHAPRIVTSIAMFYDLEDPIAFVSDVRAVMDPEGLWVVQMSYLPAMLQKNEVGNICHEHLAYYSLASFENVLARCDMEVVDVELNEVNGGSFRAYVRTRGAKESGFGDATYRQLARERIALLRESETSLDLANPQTYLDFRSRVDRIRADVVGYIREQASRNKRVYVYGASTKGNTLLQYFGLDHSLITAASERNPEKWGKVTVGTRIPIVSEEEARRANPEFFLVLPWHFLDEFMAREREYLRDGGRFIVPMPYFTLI